MSPQPRLTAPRREFRELAETEVGPYAALCDREERLPVELIAALRTRGCFELMVDAPDATPTDALTRGLLLCEIARISASVHGLLNVHGMAAAVIARWGRSRQKREWLPRLASGRALGAIAITEDRVGSDATGVETRADPSGGGYKLWGRKRWITCGQIADLFLLLARCPEGPTAFIVDRASVGFRSEPMREVLGCRGYMLASLSLEGCHVSEDLVVGAPGFGLPVMAAALEAGRFGVAWGSLGIARAALDASLRYADRRTQFGVPIGHHQLVGALLADMFVDVEATEALCRRCAEARDADELDAALLTSSAKLFASRNAVLVANRALQVHGAHGCSSESPIERYLRDARMMEIIEGTTQIQQLLISETLSLRARQEDSEE